MSVSAMFTQGWLTDPFASETLISVDGVLGVELTAPGQLEASLGAAGGFLAELSEPSMAAVVGADPDPLQAVLSEPEMRVSVGHAEGIRATLSSEE